MTFRILSPRIKPTYLHVFVSPTGAQIVVDYDDYDEAMLQLDEGIGQTVDGTYRYSLELPADVSTGIKRFDAESKMDAWRADQRAEMREQVALARWYGGVR